MKSGLLVKFLIRWLACGLGLWIAAAILGSDRLKLGDAGTSVIVAAIISGFFLALINMLLKPLIVFLSLPAILITLGLFMLVVNGLIVLIAGWIYSSLYVKNLWVAILAGIILSLVNFLISHILDKDRARAKA